MDPSGFGTIIQIGDVLVSEDVVCEYFACDYPVCGGACCIEGDSGAPLEEDDAARLETDYPKFSSLMSEPGRRKAEDTGFFELDRDGELVTPCVPGTSECAYCRLEEMSHGKSALCAIEMAGCDKPVSCALYPIRVSKMPGGGLALNLHRWKICAPAFEKGRREGIRAYEFLRAPIIRRFGPDFYDALRAYTAEVLPRSHSAMGAGSSGASSE